MTHRLTSEERQRIGQFIEEPIPARWPESLRRRMAGSKQFAALLLRADLGQATPAELEQMRELHSMTAPAWSWVERGPDAPFRAYTDERPALTSAERNAKSQQEHARRVVAGWIGHPAVRTEAASVRAEAKDLVEPLALTDQLIVTLVAGHFLGGTARYPDGSEWPNPFPGAPADLCEIAEAIQPRFVKLLGQLAGRIAAAGAPLDQSDPAQLLALAQVVLLDVDLARPPADIVAGLNIWPPGSVDREAAAAGHLQANASRHGRTARFQASLTSFGEQVVAQSGPPPIRLSYAAGLPRRKAKPSAEQARRRVALLKVIHRFPDASPGRIRATWASSADTPGGLLRQLLGLYPHDPPPGESTLRDDLRRVRR